MPEPDEPQLPPREPTVRVTPSRTIEEAYRDYTREALLKPCSGCAANARHIAELEDRLRALEEGDAEILRLVRSIKEHLQRIGPD